MRTGGEANDEDGRQDTRRGREATQTTGTCGEANGGEKRARQTTGTSGEESNEDGRRGKRWGRATRQATSMSGGAVDDEDGRRP
jgi:hypothetical protein